MSNSNDASQLAQYITPPLPDFKSEYENFAKPPIVPETASLKEFIDSPFNETQRRSIESLDATLQSAGIVKPLPTLAEPYTPRSDEEISNAAMDASLQGRKLTYPSVKFMQAFEDITPPVATPNQPAATTEAHRG